jgi:hypothetical protein
MLHECNVPRMVMMKYTPLFMAVSILILILKMIKDEINNGLGVLLEITPLLLLMILFLILFLLATQKLKYVAIGKMEVVIKEHGREVAYNWLSVERISLNRFFRLYKLKIKDQDTIYFTPYGSVTWLFGDDSEMGAIINKMKRDLKI